VHAALKPGATFVLIDHAGNAGLDNKALHRIPEADVLALVLLAGFTIDAAPDLLANPADDHTQMVFAKGLRGKTDRFVLRLQK
jgi:predicted methyltransferase